jgi:tetratricopeptide (TPR) repeat protein
MNQKENSQKFSKFLQLLFVNKDYDGVIKESEIFLQNNTPNSAIYNFLGLSQFNQEKYDQSVDSFKKGILLDKNNFYLFQNLFHSYLKLNLQFSAIKSALAVIKLNSQIIDPYLWVYRLFNCDKSKNKILKKLCKNINFEKIKIPNNFFNFLLMNEEYETGIFICNILSKSKNNHIIFNLLGQFYFLNQQLELAKKSQLKSLSLKNDYYYTYYDLAEIFKTQGNLIEAKNYYMQAIKHNNQNIDGELHRSFSSVNKYKSLQDDHVVQMQNFLLSEAIDEKNKSQLNFALAKAYEDIKEYELSYNSFNSANKLYFKNLNYSSEFFLKEVSIFKNFYLKNKKNLIGEKQIGFLESNPIFIIGLPRSGSTLVEQIISSHSQVTIYGE